jgi:hypothetical protein
MNRKIIFSLIVILILLVIAGGFFWWWQDQKDIRELNKNLPKGVRVVKSLKGEYRVVNKIDGYEFKVPEEWQGIKKITYYEQTEKEASGISIDAQNGDLFGIGVIKLENERKSLESWVQEHIIKSMPPNWRIEKQFLNGTEIFKLVTEKQPLSETPSYFFKVGSKIYNISGTSKDSTESIITKGRW